MIAYYAGKSMKTCIHMVYRVTTKVIELECIM